MEQVARNLTDSVDGFLVGKRFLIHDRDPLFTQEFRDILRAAGVRCLKLPAHSPDLNAFAERFVLSIKSECLNKLIPLGERHLRHAVDDGAVHGTRVGILDAHGMRHADLVDAEGKVLPVKGEGIAAVPGSPDRVYVVLDSDDPDVPSELCTVEPAGPWRQ